MRLVKIPNLEYDDYERIADAIYSVIPFAVINTVYRKKLKTGFFNFWDSDYIPDELKKFIVQPPMSRENKDKMKEAILEALSLTIEKAERIRKQADEGLAKRDKGPDTGIKRVDK